MGKRMVILGAAESGVGAAVLAQKKGFDVFVSDMGKIKPHYVDMLDRYGIAWEDGGHTEELVLNADEVIKSPGIPEDAPMVLKVKAAGIPIISEIEFAGRYTHAKMICITGSNGKTTTTSLIYHIFKKAGYNVGLAGNIGQSLALQVAEKDYDYYVIELSSFQLDNMYRFRANIAVLLTSRLTIWTVTTIACRIMWMPKCAFCRTRKRRMLSFTGMTTRLSGKNWRNTRSRPRNVRSPS